MILIFLFKQNICNVKIGMFFSKKIDYIRDKIESMQKMFFIYIVGKQTEISGTRTLTCSMNAELICFPGKPLVTFSLHQLNITQSFVKMESDNGTMSQDRYRVIRT